MAEKTSGRGLSLKRTGGGLLSLIDLTKSGAAQVRQIPDPAQETGIAAWQTLETGVPHRCVIRCDGWVQSNKGNLQQSGIGFPCGVLKVDYAIGGYNRTTLIEAVNQSALVVWAESIEVTKVWDIDRFNALKTWWEGQENNFPGMSLEQRVAVAISLDDRGGDTGEADARHWDVVSFKNAPITSSHRIPDGARALRLLDGSTGSDAIAPFSDYLTGIKWSDQPDGFNQIGSILYQDPIPDGNCALEVPPVATHLHLTYATFTTDIAAPFIIEWVLAPAYK